MFEGANVAIVTPFKNGMLDEVSLRNLIDFQIENGTHGIVPCGTTGESPTLTVEEHERVIEITVEHVNKRVSVIAGTGSNNTAEAIALTRFAKRAGADGALMITPYYNKPSQAGLYSHFEKVAKTVDIPIVLYNVPGRTGSSIDPDTVSKLSKIDNIVGIKEASGSMKQVTDIIARCGSDFAVLSGEDYLTFPLICVGGKGVISVVSNVEPKGMADLCNLALGGKLQEAQHIFYKLLSLCHILFIETNPVPVKAALTMMGKIPSGELRLPLVQLSEANQERLRKEIEACGLIPKAAKKAKA